MSRVKQVKQRVCMAIFTMGLSLAGFHGIDCLSVQDSITVIPALSASTIVMIKV